MLTGESNEDDRGGMLAALAISLVVGVILGFAIQGTCRKGSSGGILGEGLMGIFGKKEADCPSVNTCCGINTPARSAVCADSGSFFYHALTR